MKAYQVFSGEINKHGFQKYKLEATFLSLPKAQKFFDAIVDNETKTGEDRVELFPKYDEQGEIIYLVATIQDWEYIDIAKIEKIDIVE